MDGDGGMKLQSTVADPATGGDAVSRRVIGCIIRVHRVLGPGFIESVYHRALVVELTRQGLAVQTEVEVPVYYEGTHVGTHRLDLVVEGRLIVELKTVEALSKAHYAQLRSYLKASGIPHGILVNFSTERADYRRVTRP